MGIVIRQKKYNYGTQGDPDPPPATRQLYQEIPQAPAILAPSAQEADVPDVIRYQKQRRRYQMLPRRRLWNHQQRHKNQKQWHRYHM